MRGEPVRGGELEAAPPHLLVVIEVRTTAPPATTLDVIGEQSAQPQRVVPEVRPTEKASLRISALDRRSELGKRVVSLIIALCHAVRAFAQSELDEETRNIVGET